MLDLIPLNTSEETLKGELRDDNHSTLEAMLRSIRDGKRTSFTYPEPQMGVQHNDQAEDVCGRKVLAESEASSKLARLTKEGQHYSRGQLQILRA